MKRLCLDSRIALLLGAAVLAVYAATMARTIYTGDDGDFLVAMTTFGTSHPTGYPIFLLLGKLFLTLTAPLIAEPAARLNLMTALFGAGAVGLFYRFCHTVLHDRLAAAAAALLLAFAPTLWQQSLSCEVYSLTALYLTGALWLAARWAQSPGDERLLGRLALVYGLALTNHLTPALFLPGFIGLIVARRPELLRRWRVLLGLVWRFALPLCAYAYLPLAARYGHSPVNWGNPQTRVDFWEHVSGAQYRGLMFVDPLALWPQRLSLYAKMLGGEFGWALVLAPLGLWALARRARWALGLTLWIFAANVVFGTNYKIADIYVYFIPSYLCVALWIGAGGLLAATSVLDRLKADRVRLGRIVGALAVAAPIVALSQNWVATDKSANFLESDLADNVLRSCPKDALVLTPGSLTFTLWYRKWVQNERPDIAVVNHELLLGALLDNRRWYYDHVRRQWPGIRDTYPDHRVRQDQLLSGQFLTATVEHALRSGKPVIVVPDTLSDDRTFSLVPGAKKLLKPFVRVPWGIAERLYLPGTAPGDAAALAENERLWPTFRTRGVYTGWVFSDPQQRHIPIRYFEALKALGQLAERQGHADTARQAYQGALRLYRDPEIDAALKRLGPETASRR